MRVVSIIFLVISVTAAIANAQIVSKNHVGALNVGLMSRMREQGLETEGMFEDSSYDQWFTQTLDHFDSQNPTTWQQRFMINDTFFKGGDAPIFIMLGGEGPIAPAYVSGHFVSNLLAQEFGALIVAVEHRYYGKSVPTVDSSTPNLRWLSSQQALVDLVTIREYIAKKFAASGKWIVFGGSYSGALSAWLRAKYPNSYAGSIASSGPVLAQTDFQNYLNIVSRSMGAKCSSVFAAATASIDQLLLTSEGQAQLATQFNTCGPLDNDNAVQLFIQTIVGGPSGVVQYNNDNVNYQPFNVSTMCATLESNTDPLAAVAELTKGFQKGACIETNYTQYINELQPTSAARSWIYQTCREFGFFQAADGDAQPFPKKLTLEFSLQQCKDIFGADFSPNTEFTNEYYGNVNLQTSNTFAPYGSVDPWHMLGLCYDKVGPGRDIGPNSQSLLIDGTAHCADLYPPRASDEPGLTYARQVELSLISSWLATE